MTSQDERSELPVGSGPETAVAVPRRAELLDRLPGPLPVIGRAVTGIAFAPGPIARIAADPTRPMRVVCALLEEVEEFQFSVLRRRTSPSPRSTTTARPKRPSRTAPAFRPAQPGAAQPR
ncbi:MAG: hypothetical protein M3Z25_03945 [Actinomycetota bacterium]|nr:hypothetical protein [Actinomycetota bacterium]